VIAPRRWVGFCAALLVLVACGDKAVEQRAYTVSVRALNQDDEPLANLDIVANGQPVGRSDAHGAALIQLTSREGASFLFEPRCPEGMASSGEPATLRLRTLGNGPPPEVEVRCARLKRMAALIVSAPGYGDLPVMVHNREMARTDVTGTAHLLLEGDPSTPIRVVLNTASRPKVVPPSPHKDLQIGSRDDIVVFAPELSEIREAPPPKKHKVREKKPPPVLRPEKLR
jgi:hypothetical protein